MLLFVYLVVHQYVPQSVSLHQSAYQQHTTIGLENYYPYTFLFVIPSSASVYTS